MTSPIDVLAELFAGEGAQTYLGEEVSLATHMLQAAALAEGSGAPDHLVAPRSYTMLGISRRSAQPVRLRVMAKRYLCIVDRRYLGELSPASRQTLSLQGGPLTETEARVFERLTYGPAAVAVRRWDEAAKDPAVATPPFAHFRPLLNRMNARPTDS
jgi:gamma-butyrobetaine dioxygenase